MRGFLILIGLLGLAACSGAGGAGKGPITLAPNAKASLDRYMSQARPGAFLVTADGRAVGWSFCPEAGCFGDELQAAYKTCRSNAAGRDCFLYAEGRRVVWQQ